MFETKTANYKWDWIGGWSCKFLQVQVNYKYMRILVVLLAAIISQAAYSQIVNSVSPPERGLTPT